MAGNIATPRSGGMIDNYYTRTTLMSKELETLQEILSASKRLEEQLIARETRIEELERENQDLRRQCEETGLALNAALRDASAAYLDEIHAQLDPSTRTGVDFEHVMNELETVYQKHDRGNKDVG